MYWKVIKNKKVIDVLDKLQYCRFQLKHKTLLLCDESVAQGILSHDGTTAYHLETCSEKFPIDIFPICSVEEIDKYEYESLLISLFKSPDEIANEIIKELIERGVM